MKDFLLFRAIQCNKLKMEMIESENSAYMEISKTKGDLEKRKDDFEKNMEKQLTLFLHSRFHVFRPSLRLKNLDIEDDNLLLKLAKEYGYYHNFQHQCGAMLSILAYVNTQLDLVLSSSHLNQNQNCRLSYLLYEKFNSAKQMVDKLTNLDVVNKKFQKTFTKMVQKYCRAYLTFTYWKSGINTIVAHIPNDTLQNVLEYL